MLQAMAKAEESTNKFATISHGGIEFMASTCQVSGPNQLIKVDAGVYTFGSSGCCLHLNLGVAELLLSKIKAQAS